MSHPLSWCAEPHNFSDGSGSCCCTLAAGHSGPHHSVGIGRWRNAADFEAAVDIIKTWPAAINPRTTVRVFRGGDPFHRYYFSLGRGKPKFPIGKLWFTWRSRILGSFLVDEVVVNDGSIPPLRRLDGGDSEWQMKPDVHVAICEDGCKPLRERLYYSGFQGWRYFDINTYRNTPDSHFRI